MKTIKLKKRKQQAAETSTARITNETVAEHRERILAGGRKFKYPHQYVRHKLVINTILIGLVTVLLVTAAGWFALYKAQNTSEFMYRVTRVLPVPVADVDGEAVRYSDYLMRYRSQEMWFYNRGQLGPSKEDDKRQLDFFKRQVLDGLEKDMYAQKRARQLNVSVSDKEVQGVVDNNRHTATGEISQEVYDASTKDTLGYSPDEYRHIIKQSLLRQKVAFVVDTEANKLQQAVADALSKRKAKDSLQDIVQRFKKQEAGVEYGASGLVPKNNQDGGLSQEAGKLRNGQISGVVKSTTGDGYYFVQRLSGDDRQISYQYIKIPLTVFDQQFVSVQKQHKIHEYISIHEVKS